jgi:hypothetical protein
LSPFAPAHRGVDLDEVLRSVRGARDVVATGSLALRPLELKKMAG